MAQPPCSLRPGQELELKLEGLVDGGEALARHQGLPVFVPGGVPGDLVRARVLSTKPGYARALIQQVLEKSEQRVAAPCPYFGACGGCQWQELAYPAQLAWKWRLVEEALRRIGGIEAAPLLEPTLGMDEPWHYRNKAHWAISRAAGHLEVGFYEPRSHQVVDVTACAIQHPTLNRVLSFLREALPTFDWPIYDEATQSGLLRSAFAKVGHRTQDLMIGLVTTREALPNSEAWVALAREAFPEAAIVQNVHPRPGNALLGERTRVLAGRDQLIEQIGELAFAISARSFFQVNPFQVERLYGLVAEYLAIAPGARIVDAYAGTGTIALYLARQGAGEVIGIESVPEAVRDAEANAARNGIARARWITGTVEGELARLLATEKEIAAVVLDPPRKGCEPGVIAALGGASIPRIAYVSCNPATLARDLKRLEAHGYRLARARPVDMFPQTSHVETVVLLERVTV